MSEALSGAGRRVGRSGTGALLGERRRVGRFGRWASSPGFSFGRPCDLPGLSFELVSVCVVVPLVLPRGDNRVEVTRWDCAGWVGRAIGLDVHRDFCVVAICEDGRVRSAGRVPSTPEGIRTLAESLLAVRPGGVGGDGRLLGGRADPRAARESGGGGQPGRHRDHERQGEDGQARRARRWRACCGRASLRRCGCPMSAAGSCAAGSRAASS